MMAVDGMPSGVQLPTVKMLEDSFMDHGPSSIWDAVEEMTNALDDSRSEAEQELLDAKASLDLANAQNLVAVVAASELALALKRSEACRLRAIAPVGVSTFGVVYALVAVYESSMILQKSGALCFMALSLALEAANGHSLTGTTLPATSAMLLALKQARDARALAEAATLKASADEAALEDAEEAAAFAESALELLEREAMEAQEINAVAITTVVWMSAVAFEKKKAEYSEKLELAHAEVEKTKGMAESFTNEMAIIAKDAVETAALALRKIKAREAKLAIAESVKRAATEVNSTATSAATASDVSVKSAYTKGKRKAAEARAVKVATERRRRKKGVRNNAAMESVGDKGREVTTRARTSTWEVTLERVLVELLRICIHVCSLRAIPICFWGV